MTFNSVIWTTIILSFAAGFAFGRVKLYRR